MATERNVVDFKIHNLTEEQFQELKAQGKIDPNAVYCTPDTTKERLDALETKTTSLEENKQDKGDYATNTALSQKQDKATAVNYDNITNCITEIPQDIKLELNNGTLTLKAGSKLYVPNGSGTFDILTLTADKTATQTTNDTRLYFYNGTYIEKFPVAQCYSGDTAPSGNTYMFWFDTVNNLMKMTTNGGSTWTSGWSLPFCIATASSGALTSIDQVFNGFGYIGSTVFSLPGVKIVIPNGRNEDGTLTNVYRPTNVSTLQVSGTSEDAPVLVSNAGKLYSFNKNIYYDEKSNMFVRADGTPFGVFQCGSVSFTQGKITSFKTKTTFHAVDYNDLTDTSKNTIAIAAPVGIVSAFAGKTPPSGWLKCDGSAVSRTTYEALFSAIGTTYGAGNGSTTFNLPTQSVLPLGTTAPVATNATAINQILAIKAPNIDNSLHLLNTNTAQMLQVTTNGDGQKTLYADLSQTTGAKAIACIKY